MLNPRGRLIHDGGVTRFPGLYLMGMPFLRRRKSTLIDGAAADARDLTAHLATHLDARVRAGGLAAAQLDRAQGVPCAFARGARPPEGSSPSPA